MVIAADVLRREFCGLSLSIVTIEVDQSLNALIKLQICDMCYFDNYACQLQSYYYNLDVASQRFISELFFAKLPEPWPEVAKKAFDPLLNEDKIVDGLGGRIEVENEELVHELVEEDKIYDLDYEVESIYEVVSEYKTNSDEDSYLWIASMFMIHMDEELVPINSVPAIDESFQHEDPFESALEWKLPDIDIKSVYKT
ncbi:uncharacterized protein LOC116189853 [Punica granatum]|uniref:Uncharacterized protein LOC116189853 n=1 Tax=Punica granatum TaxID=22663 RepID=A0A6P8BYR4_PUNGR|nr:uncharacterized protein LOC116189853 [Punica granatum]